MNVVRVVCFSGFCMLEELVVCVLDLMCVKKDFL